MWRLLRTSGNCEEKKKEVIEVAVDGQYWIVRACCMVQTKGHASWLIGYVERRF